MIGRVVSRIGRWVRVSDKIEGYILRGLSNVTNHALTQPEPKRKNMIRKIMPFIELTKNYPPDHAYKYYNLLGLCYLGLDERMQSLEYFERMLDSHPSPSSDSDFGSYVVNYLKCVKELPNFPKPRKENVTKGTITRIQGLFTILPNVDYNLYDHLGFCYSELRQLREAVANHEQAVLRHPKPTPDTDFPGYVANYLFSVRTASQDAIRRLRKRDAIDQLVYVINSTARVGMRYPELKEVRQEHLAAYSWFQESDARFKVDPNIITFNPN